MRNRLWAISTYYNYSASPYRTSNLRMFRQKLQIPLILVEYSLNEQFRLGPEVADIHVSISGSSLLWQKERLLNQALQHIPDDCEAIAWIDGDLIFPCAEWVDDCLNKLSRYRMVQLFDKVIHLPEGTVDYTQHRSDQLFFEQGLAASIRDGAEVDDVLYVKPERLKGQIVNGMAWAADRALLETTGFYDACIVGGGDTAIAAAAFGKFDAAIQWHCMNTFQREYYLTWARRFWKEVHGNVTALDQDIYHLWHGTMSARRSGHRHQGLSKTGFNPATDIRIDKNGAWALKDRNPGLRAFLNEYFGARDNAGKLDVG